MAVATVINAMAVRLDRYFGGFCMIRWGFVTIFEMIEKGYFKKVCGTQGANAPEDRR